jgi:DNA-binding NtrC family response regulator
MFQTFDVGLFIARWLVSAPDQTKLQEELVVKNADSQILKCVLIDDSADFRFAMSSLSSEYSIQMDTFSSLAEMGSISKLRSYEVIIVDYFLESWVGTEIAEYVDALFGNIPVVVISAATTIAPASWPKCIRAFLSKSIGPRELLREVSDKFGVRMLKDSKRPGELTL